MEDKQSLGAYVAARRKVLGLRQSDLADVLGYTTQAICSFEMGKSQPSVLLLPSLANALGESLDDLIFLNPNPAPLIEKNARADPSLLTKNLASIRNRDGLSLDEEAEILGVNKRTVVNYEKGLTTLSLSCLLNLLKHDSLKASDFFYHDLASVAPVPAHAPNKKIRKSLFLFPAVCLTVGCLVVGITSPLLAQSMKVGGQKSDGGSSLSEETFSFGQDDTSSASADSSSASADSSSWTSPFPSVPLANGDLSPDLPGLKKMDVYDEWHNSSGAKVCVGSLIIGFDSGDFDFASRSWYTFEFLLIGAPAGVTLTAKSFLERTLTVTSEVPDYASFYVQIKAYSTLSKDQPCYGAPFQYFTYNPPGVDAVDSLRGLRSITLLANGISTEEKFLTTGSYSLSLKCSPENYLIDSHSSVTYRSFTANPVVVGDVLTIAPTTNYSFNTSAFSIDVRVVGEFGSHTFSFPIPIKNPPDKGNYANYPSLRAIYLTYKGSPCLRSWGGEYDIDVSYLMEDGVQPYFNDGGWEFNLVTPAFSLNQGFPDILPGFTGISGPIHIKIPAFADQKYTYGYFSLAILSRSDSPKTFCSAPFHILFGA